MVKGEYRETDLKEVDSAPLATGWWNAMIRKNARERTSDREPAPSPTACISSAFARGDANRTCPDGVVEGPRSAAMPATRSFAGPVGDTGISLPLRLHFIISGMLFAMERHVHRVKNYCLVIARDNWDADVEIMPDIAPINIRTFIG